MKEIKKYTDVIRYGKKNTENVLNVGDVISITEKIDGANGSFCLDNENPLGISIFSRKTQVTENNTLRGFYGWCIDNVQPIKDILNKDYRYFGEWVCSHKVVYKKNVYQNFYLFSIWNEVEERYESDDIVKLEAKRLGLKTVPYLYEGEFISYEHLISFVGKSDLSATKDTGEGIVVKNTNYVDSYGKQCFVKLVTKKFAEVQKQRPPKTSKIDDELNLKIGEVLTRARIEKLMFKLIDEGIFKLEDFIIENMGSILKHMSIRIYEDIIKEESEIFAEFEEVNVKRGLGKKIPSMVKAIIIEGLIK